MARSSKLRAAARRVREGVSELWQDLRHRRRRIWRKNGRSHIELRDLPPTALERLAPVLVETLESIDGVDWARVNAPLRRVIVQHAASRDPRDLAGVVDVVEEQLGLDRFPLEGPRVEHPGDREPVVRTKIEMAADAAGLTGGLAMRIAGVRPLPFDIDIAAITSMFQNFPQARRLLDERLGRPTTDLGFNLLNATTQAFLQGSTGPAVDVLRRWLRLRELLARQELWAAREEALCGRPELHDVSGCGASERPVPLPPGPIERWADKATAATLGGFGLGMMSTGSIESATAPVFGGVPRPARLGREAFAAQLGVILARRGVVAVDRHALRRLDRIDAVVVDASLVTGAAGAARDPSVDAFEATVRRLGLAREAARGEDEAIERVRRLQLERRGVLFVGSGWPRACRAADVAIGVPRPGAPPPWGADLILPTGLDDALLVLDSLAAARDASRQSVQIAAVEAGMTLLLSMGGLEAATARRVMTASSAATVLSMGNGLRLAHALGARPVVPPRDPTPWHALDPAEALARLGSSGGGLDEVEAARRVPPRAEEAPPWRVFAGMALDEVVNPLAPILAAGAGLSALMGSVVDAGLIAGVVGFNSLVGATQRYRTERALGALLRRERRHVRVRRGGTTREVPPDELVVGDVIQLDAGEVVPADCRILESHGLELDESSLTGESLPVHKTPERSRAEAVAERTSMIYDGTTVAAGTVRAVIVAAGEATEARRGVAEARAGAGTDGGVEARLERLTELTGPAAAVAGLVLVGAGMARRRPPEEVLGTGVSLAVAAIPEGLPLLATMAQLAAAKRLEERGALVRNPRAVEALGRVDVLCADKTGTLTEGQIRLRSVSDGTRELSIEHLEGPHRCVLAAALRASPDGDGGRPPHLTDRAILDGGREAGVSPDEDLACWERLAELPFEPGRGYHAVQGRAGDAMWVSVKGAPEVILPRCLLDEGERARLHDEAIRMARRGLRVLAVAERRSGTDRRHLRDHHVERLELRGFVGLADPIRATARQALDDLRRAGIRVIMVTGDHPSTAQAIAVELGIAGDDGLITGPELDAMADEALDARIGSVRVFARVTPVQKVRIVQALRRAGRVVAMTGDGANDAPAIRLADVGIAIGEGATTAAREAADVVVTDERIETIVASVLEGRALWASVRDAVSLLVGGNLGEIAFTLIAGLLSGRSPLNARQLLLVNLLTDTAPALAVALRPPAHLTPEQLMREGPEASLGEALDRDILWRALLTSSSTAGAWIAARTLGGNARADTVALLTLVGSQLGQTLTTGSRSGLVIGTSLLSGAALLGVVQTPGLSHFFGCRPLGPIGLAQAGIATAAATGVSFLFPKLADKLPIPEAVRRRHEREPARADEPAGPEPAPEPAAPEPEQPHAATG